MHASQIQRERGAARRVEIADYFRANPLATQHECAKDLGISRATVARHAGELRAEWLAQRQQEQAGA